MVNVTTSYFLKTFSFEGSNELLDFCLANSIILYFWYVLESILKFIIELHAVQSLSVRRCNKKQRRCRITLNFTKREIFKKGLPFPFSLFKKHSIRWGINPPFKNCHPLFLDKPPLNLQTVQAPLFMQSLLFIGFLWNLPYESYMFQFFHL